MHLFRLIYDGPVVCFPGNLKPTINTFFFFVVLLFSPPFFRTIACKTRNLLGSTFDHFFRALLMAPSVHPCSAFNLPPSPFSRDDTSWSRLVFYFLKYKIRFLLTLCLASTKPAMHSLCLCSACTPAHIQHQTPHTPARCNYLLGMSCHLHRIASYLLVFLENQMLREAHMAWEQATFEKQVQARGQRALRRWRTLFRGVLLGAKLLEEYGDHD